MCVMVKKGYKCVWVEPRHFWVDRPHELQDKKYLGGKYSGPKTRSCKLKEGKKRKKWSAEGKQIMSLTVWTKCA